ncbi:MAG: DMT family transporter [Pseudomonadota bacterium]|nr:DMT family transporter [Pseudomonadota bacterium]
MINPNRKTNVDTFGAVSLVLISGLLGINHVVIKIVNDGINPVLFCGLRSLIAMVCIYAWMRYRGLPIVFFSKYWKYGLLAGFVFAAEFLFLFVALDYTTVVRNSIIYYSMPLWLSLLAHFVLPNEKINAIKVLGLVLAFLGVVWAFFDKETGETEFTLIGDLFALAGALGWAALILVARGTKFSLIKPEMQLLWMVTVSAPILMASSFLYSELIRDFVFIHILGLLFQAIVVVTFGFIFWLWLLAIYPASGVASFAFLTPLFGITFGWLILDEQITAHIFASGFMVILGIYLINRGDTKSEP